MKLAKDYDWLSLQQGKFFLFLSKGSDPRHRHWTFCHLFSRWSDATLLLSIPKQRKISLKPRIAASVTPSCITTTPRRCRAIASHLKVTGHPLVVRHCPCVHLSANNAKTPPSVCEAKRARLLSPRGSKVWGHVRATGGIRKYLQRRKFMSKKKSPAKSQSKKYTPQKAQIVKAVLLGQSNKRRLLLSINNTHKRIYQLLHQKAKTQKREGTQAKAQNRMKNLPQWLLNKSNKSRWKRLKFNQSHKSRKKRV